MATFQKRRDKWRARIIRRPLGIDESATFPTKSQAQAWATKREAEILAGARGIPSHHLVSEAIDLFVKIETNKRRGGRWEAIRLAVFRKHKLALRPIAKVTSEDIARWRDERLTQVSPSSVAREMNLWAALFSVAVREWKWISANPCKGVKRPSEPPARRRGISEAEVSALVAAMNGGPSILQVRQAFLLSLETAMRAGEILSLTWDHVDLQNRVVTLPRTKNGDSRQVPLSTKAIDILRELKAARPVEDRAPHPKEDSAPDSNAFTITSATLDTLFRRARDKAAVDCPSCATVRFHDARGEAITRLSKHFDALELARAVGHRDLSSLLIYYSASAAELAKKLD